MKRLVIAVVIALCLVGTGSLVSVVSQLRTDYQNFRKIVIWVAQKQVQEEQARQRQLQLQQQRNQQAAQPVVPTAQAEPPKK